MHTHITYYCCSWPTYSAASEKCLLGHRRSRMTDRGRKKACPCPWWPAGVHAVAPCKLILLARSIHESSAS
jgi:hypothetical protein